MQNKYLYQRHVKRHHLFVILLLFLSFSGYSQETTSCAENLRNAQTLFERGQVELVPAMLEECMKSGFTREESLAANRLIIQCYLFNDRLEMADSTMLEFLKKNPEYQLSPTDHSSFVNLFEKFTVKPVVQIALHIGINLPYITFIDPKSASPVPGKNVYNTEPANFYGSVEAKFKITNKLEVNFEPGYSQLAFTNVEDFQGFEEITYKESQIRLELPVSVTYNIKSFGKFTPYGRLGAGPALNLGSSASTINDALDLNGTDRSGPDIDRKDSRILMDVFAQAGAGMKFKTRGGFIFAELRTNVGIFNQTVRGENPTEELGGYYFYVDDEFHINALNFNLGYTQIFYKPSKRKE